MCDMCFISVNQNGETALDIARRMKNAPCEELVSVILYIQCLISVLLTLWKLQKNFAIQPPAISLYSHVIVQNMTFIFWH